jgi:hypothetical protein
MHAPDLKDSWKLENHKTSRPQTSNQGNRSIPLLLPSPDPIGSTSSPTPRRTSKLQNKTSDLQNRTATLFPKNCKPSKSIPLKTPDQNFKIQPPPGRPVRQRLRRR